MIGIIAGIATFAVLYFAQVPLALGAHPQWAQSVVSIGAPIGLFGFMALIKTNKTVLSAVGIAGLVAAYVTAVTGKARFVASYADDTIAGQMWFYGWIAACTFAVFAVSAVAQRLTDRSRGLSQK